MSASSIAVPDWKARRSHQPAPAMVVAEEGQALSVGGEHRLARIVENNARGILRGRLAHRTIFESRLSAFSTQVWPELPVNERSSPAEGSTQVRPAIRRHQVVAVHGEGNVTKLRAVQSLGLHRERLVSASGRR